MEEKNQKRRDILKSAMVLFRDKGFHNTKMEDIAAGAGVGKGTLYEYFESKQDIFDETCIEYVNEIVNKIKCISDLKDTFHNKLLILFNENLKMESDITLDDVLSSKNIISEDAIKAIIGKMFEMYELICGIIDRGKEEGVVISDIQSEIIACILIGTMGQHIRLKSHNKEDVIKEDDIIFDLLYKGFAVK